MKSIKKLVLVGLVLLASVMVLAGCKNDSVPEVPKYTVKFETLHGTAPKELVVESGTKLTAEQLKIEAEVGDNIFEYWYEKDTPTQKVEAGYSVTKNVTLVAKWRDRGTVNGGSSDNGNTGGGTPQQPDGGGSGNTTENPEVPHEHSFADEWSTDGTHHWKAATCEHTGEVSEEAEHTFGDWTIVKAPSETENGSKKRVCSVCKYEGIKVIEKLPENFVFVLGGRIEGAEYTDNDEGVFIAGRTVTLSDFYMGKYEVTQEEYASVMAGQKVTVDGQEYQLESNPSYCTENSTEYTLFAGDDPVKRPVEGVTWYDAVWYCNVLSEEANLSPAYNIEVTEVKRVKKAVSEKRGYYIYGATVTLNKDANGYRLPTEAEWEYAARGGNPGAKAWNYTFSGADKAEGTNYSDKKNTGLDTVGWYWYNTATGTTGDSGPTSGSQGFGTHQVGKEKKANSLGIYDMSGNVWEWCWDWSGTVETGEETDPTGASSGSYRVLRGGGWNSYAGRASVSFRNVNYPYDRSFNFGFRVVCASSK